MKALKYLLIIVLFIQGSFAFAGFLVNTGAKIKVSSGTYVNINGNVRTDVAGTDIVNNGVITLNGDWTNNVNQLMSGSNGTVNFNGTTPQIIGGSGTTYFNNLSLNNECSLGHTIRVYGNFGFSSDNMILGNYNVEMQAGSSISGAGPGSYFIASGSGYLIQAVGASDVQFQVGTASSYVPVALNNAGVIDAFGVNVFGDVRTNGLTGSTIPEIDDCVNMTWNVVENSPGGSDLSVTASWPASLEGPNFDRNHAGLGHYIAGDWDPMEEVIASGANPYSITRSGISSLSPFAVGDLESPMAVEVQLRIDLKVFLEGPYAGSGSMNTNLNSDGYIPLSQPYNPALPYYDNASPVWQYAGTESVPSIPAGTVDWVVVQLRDATAPGNATSATIIGTQAAFVLDDGTIVALDGASTLTFNINFSQNLYAVVFHRNHLGIISNNALTPSAGIYSYDFTTGEFQAYGGANGHKEIEPGVWGMISADGNGNGLIQNTDETAVWKADLGNSGYMGGDFNMNGLTQNTDETDYWKVNLGAGGQTPSKANTGYQSQVPN